MRKKKNKMSVFTLGYSPRYYLIRPWKFFKEVYWNMRNFIHRGRYGFAYCDVWCMDEYLLNLIPLMLRYLGEHSHGYPGVEPYETYEKYQQWLFDLAEKFEQCQDDGEWRNEYYEPYIQALNKQIEENREATEEEKELTRKYLDCSKKAFEENDKAIIEAYKELAEHHQILWD